MALKINEECIDCGACEPECPNGAITEGVDIYVIDPELCTECYGFYTTQQCADVCPVEACVADSAHCEAPSDLHVKFTELYPEALQQNTERWKPPAV